MASAQAGPCLRQRSLAKSYPLLTIDGGGLLRGNLGKEKWVAAVPSRANEHTPRLWQTWFRSCGQRRRDSFSQEDFFPAQIPLREAPAPFVASAFSVFSDDAAFFFFSVIVGINSCSSAALVPFGCSRAIRQLDV